MKPKKKIKLHNIKTLEAHLKGLQSEIGLSDDDIMIMIYTSLDLDYFCHLLVMQGQFLNWFTINFAGESREE